MSNKFHQIKLKKMQNIAYQVESYDDIHQGSQLPAAEYAALNGMICLSGEDGLPNICLMGVQGIPPVLEFRSAITGILYLLQPRPFIGARPDPRR